MPFAISKYQPNLIARSLKTNRTNTLGIVVPDITIPTFSTKIVRGAEAAAERARAFPHRSRFAAKP